MMSVYLDFLELSKEDQRKFLRKVLKKGGKKLDVKRNYIKDLKSFNSVIIYFLLDSPSEK